MYGHTQRNEASGHQHKHQTLAVFRPGCVMNHLIKRLTFVCPCVHAHACVCTHSVGTRIN